MTRHLPSYQEGFAPRDFMPEFPALWQGCIGAWCPSLGPTGLRIMDWSGFQRVMDLGVTPTGCWTVDGGQYCYSSNGSTTFAVCSSITGTALTALSTALWFKINATSGQGVWSWGDAAEDSTPFLLLRNNGWLLYDGAYNTTLSLTTGRWYHLAMTRNVAGNWVIYLDGLQVDTHTDDGTPADQSSATRQYIGVSAGGYSASQYDDLRTYNRALTANEVRLLATRRGIAYEREVKRGPSLQPMRPVSKVYVGGSWQQAPVKVYSGGSWKNVEPKVYSGGEWK